MSYVVVFNMLVGPVFSAGSVTSERERQTLDLLLTTVITPWQILSGKLRAGLRVSSVLTLFLLWPLLLACVMVSSYWNNLVPVGAYTLIVLLTCLNTALLALFCSVVFRKTSTSLMTTYLLIILLFCAPLAAIFFTQTRVYPNRNVAASVEAASITSPFVAAFAFRSTMEFETPWTTIRGTPRLGAGSSAATCCSPPCCNAAVARHDDPAVQDALARRRLSRTARSVAGVRIIGRSGSMADSIIRSRIVDVSSVTSSQSPACIA